MELLKAFILAFNYFVGFYYFSLNSFYSFFLFLALLGTIIYLKKLPYYYILELKSYQALPPISIVIPVYNEESVIIRTVRSALEVDYPFFEVIVVNDGSTDNTLEVLKREFALIELPFFIYRTLIKTAEVKRVYISEKYENLMVIDKERKGKSDALNCGLNFSKFPYFCTLDADSLLERDALLRLARKILDSDKPVIALGGVVRVLNGLELKDGHIERIELPKSILANFQVVEYIRAFLFGRYGIELVRGTSILSGAFSFFNKEVLINVGGFSSKTVAEDFEIIIRLHRYCRDRGEPYYIGFIPDPVCWTLVPEKIAELSKQRRRWHLGLLQTLWLNRGIFFNPRYGVLGLLIFPFYLLEAIGAVVETIGYPVVILSYFLKIVDINFLKLFFVLAILYGIFLNVGGIFLEEMSFKRYPRWSHLFRLLLFGIGENLGYRQLTSLFRFIGTFQFILGYHKWEVIKKDASHGS